MSKIQRWDVTSDMAMPRDDGRWVEYDDHATEIAALRAKLARAHAEIRLWREWAGDVLTGWPCVNGQPITRPVDEHRDLEGGAA